jgi:hypothetical protein
VITKAKCGHERPHDFFCMKKTDILLRWSKLAQLVFRGKDYSHFLA